MTTKTYNADTLRNALNPATWTEPPEPRKRLSTTEELLQKLSEVEVSEPNPDYVSYEIKA